MEETKEPIPIDTSSALPKIGFEALPPLKQSKKFANQSVSEMQKQKHQAV